MAYKSIYAGAQVDEAVGKVLDDDCVVKYGNLTGDINDQTDLIEAISASGTCKLTAETVNNVTTVYLNGEAQTFADMETLLEETKSVFIEYNGAFFFPAKHDVGVSVMFASIVKVGDVQNINYLTMNNGSVVSVSNVQPELKSNKVTSISSVSTDNQYPTARAVYDFTTTVLGDINTALEEIIGE